MNQVQWAECQEISRQLPDICRLSRRGGNSFVGVGVGFVIHSHARTSLLWANPPLWVSPQSHPAICWLVPIHLNRHFSAINVPGAIQGYLALLVAPETQPNHIAFSGYPRLFMELPVEVTWTSDVRLTFDFLSSSLIPRALKVNRYCSLQPSQPHPHPFLFFLSVTSPPEPRLLLVTSSLNFGPCPSPALLLQPGQRVFQSPPCPAQKDGAPLLCEHSLWVWSSSIAHVK